MLRVGLVGLGLVLLASLIAPFALPDPNAQDLSVPLQAPSLSHPFGTDDLGRDVLSRTLAATWLDLPVAIGVTFASVCIGVIAGTAAGYTGGWVERVVMRIADAVIAFPYLVFVLAVVAIMGPGIRGLIVALLALNWAFYARLARAEVLVLREKPFIQAAQTLGFTRRRVTFRHVLPNVLRPVAVYSMADVVVTILLIATLSFLGLGVSPPTSEWGSIIATGQDYLLSAWWISTLPGLVVVMVGFSFVLIGDALGERLGVNRDSIVP